MGGIKKGRAGINADLRGFLVSFPENLAGKLSLTSHLVGRAGFGAQQDELEKYASTLTQTPSIKH